ncbi:MAG TPA: type II toxin-antitoxin system RelE/ParE family toxin [Dyella sp.]|uniref:type II toxin-antitoxin system RelE/ParE family toxin n=1 Tax=Dyella sp. TaxID=1869338 RepID=UPI002B6CE4FD|nr:type II toxin-antitoxin system RelE/ParE family toxin [Dyella sp.]HTV84024.1 type II toxin-antitoxin system RelE/ParE family toxin [Dyella sp.]
MIKTFARKDAKALFDGESVRCFINIEKAARRKLELLEAATVLDELRVPPGNRLEALKGGRKGQHSIRINDQFRVCFRWSEGHAYDVEICDYH